MVQTARFPALPGLWEFIFVYYEPFATFSPVFFYLVWPGRFALYDMPALEPPFTPTDRLDLRAEHALFQMCNCHLLVVLFVSFVFHAARKELKDNARAQERIVGEVLKALAIVDITHMLGIIYFTLPREVWFTPSGWGTAIQTSHSIVLLNFLMRLAWFAGVRRTRYYYGQANGGEIKRML